MCDSCGPAACWSAEEESGNEGGECNAGGGFRSLVLTVVSQPGSGTVSANKESLLRVPVTLKQE